MIFRYNFLESLKQFFKDVFENKCERLRLLKELILLI